MNPPPDGDLLIRAVAESVLPADRVRATASSSDVEKVLTSPGDKFLTWSLDAPLDVLTAQSPLRWEVTANVTAHGFTRGDAKALAADFYLALLVASGTTAGGLLLSKVRCTAGPREIRFNDQATSHNRYLANYRLAIRKA